MTVKSPATTNAE